MFNIKRFYEGKKCEQCLYVINNPESLPCLYPCDVCKDRPNRNRDKSEFVDDLENKITNEIELKKKKYDF